MRDIPQLKLTNYKTNRKVHQKQDSTNKSEQYKGKVMKLRIKQLEILSARLLSDNEAIWCGHELAHNQTELIL